jgi:hypothetical protein
MELGSLVIVAGTWVAVRYPPPFRLLLKKFKDAPEPQLRGRCMATYPSNTMQTAINQICGLKLFSQPSIKTAALTQSYSHFCFAFSTPRFVEPQMGASSWLVLSKESWSCTKSKPNKIQTKLLIILPQYESTKRI